jgi:hypothetical protein
MYAWLTYEHGNEAFGSIKCEVFLTNWATTTFSRRTYGFTLILMLVGVIISWFHGNNYNSQAYKTWIWNVFTWITITLFSEHVPVMFITCTLRSTISWKWLFVYCIRHSNWFLKLPHHVLSHSTDQLCETSDISSQRQYVSYFAVPRV